MKDKDSEKYIHDLFEKAYGLGPIKERFQQTREELQNVRQTHESVMSQIGEAREAYKRNDLDSMFEIFQVPKEKILQWAVEQVQLSQMPPEQRHALEAQRAAEKRAYELEKQNGAYSQEQQQQQGELLSQMLDLVLERQDINAAAQAFDQRKGSEGSFRGLVVQLAQAEFLQTGKNLSPLEAAQKALELVGVPQAPAPQGAMQAAPATATPATAQQTPKKTMPNLANAGAKPGAAPAKAKVNSLDDIKRAYDRISKQ